jgi:3-oxoacyl-[acyl-carrier-protein] synthase II
MSIGKVFAGLRVPVSSTKALHGHLLGAGGALEMLIALEALRRQRRPVAAHLSEPDPKCDLNLVRPDQDQGPAWQHAMSNSFAFGGTNAVLIVSA